MPAKNTQTPAASGKYAAPKKKRKFRLPAKFWDLFAVPVSWILGKMSENSREDVVNPMTHQKREQRRKFFLGLLHHNLCDMLHTCPYGHFLFVELIPANKFVLPKSQIQELSLQLYSDLHTPEAKWFVCKQVTPGHYVIGINTAHWSDPNCSDRNKANDILTEANKHLRGSMFIILSRKTMRG